MIARYRVTMIALGYSGDSIVNSLSDVVAMMIGFVLAARLPAWLSALGDVALEALALAVIRDDLTLSPLMPIHPVDVVRHWEQG